MDNETLLKGYVPKTDIQAIMDKVLAESISKVKLKDAVNKIIKCSLGKWYVGRVDGGTDEVVLLDDVLRILTDLLNDKGD